MTKLLHCPRCATDTHLAFTQPCHDGGWGITCQKCHLTLDSRRETREEAIRDWNVRHSAPDDIALAKALIQCVATAGLYDNAAGVYAQNIMAAVTRSDRPEIRRLAEDAWLEVRFSDEVIAARRRAERPQEPDHA